jgi:hypothetical protein
MIKTPTRFGSGLIVLGVIVSAFWYAGLAAKGPGQMFGHPVVIYRFLENSESIGTALVSIDAKDTFTSAVEISVYFDVNNDGVFTEDEKGVDAVPAFGETKVPTAFAVIFSDESQLEVLLSDKPKNVDLKIVLRDVDTGDLLDIQEVKAKKTDWEIGKINSVEPGFIGGMESVLRREWSTFDLLSSGTAYAQNQNVNVFNKDVPDLPARKGKKNECVPISIANSLLWLAKGHNFADKLPAKVNDLIDEIETDVKWTKDKGTKQEDILPGKEKLTTDRALPLDNKKIDGTIIDGRSDLWDKIVEELKHGEDVELIMDNKPGLKNEGVDSSHAVTVVGAQSKGNNQFITVHDSATPIGNDTYKVQRDGSIDGYPVKRTQPGQAALKAFGVSIISESFRERT